MQLLLGVGRVERVEGGAPLGARNRHLLELHQLLGLLALDPGRHEAPDRGGDHLERLLHLRGGAARRRGGVVQLVGEARGHRAERREPLAVLLHAGDARHHRGDLLHHALVHRRLGEGKPAEIVGLDQSEAGGRARAHADAERPAGEHGDGAHPGGGLLAPDRLDAIAVHEHVLHLPLEQEHQAGWLHALLEHERARLVLVHPGDGDPLGELRRVEIVEQVDRVQLLERGPSHAIARYWWISETAIEPSPTALATRLIDRARTSPATKMPGTLVSSA